LGNRIELVSEREFGSQAMVVTTRRTNASAGGIVTLRNGRRGNPANPSGSSSGGDLAPRLRGRRSEGSVRSGGGEMALDVLKVL
jgi:hypothetical protein